MQALVVIGHGSHKNKHSSSAVYSHTERIRELGVFNEVIEAFWKEEPWIRHASIQAGNHEIYAVPHFMSEGYFVDEVIPRELSLYDEAKEIHYTSPVGTHPAMTRVVESRAMDALQVEDASRCSLAVIGHGTERNKKSAESIYNQVNKLEKRGAFTEVKAFFLDEEPGLEEIPHYFTSELIVAIPYLASNGLHTMEDIPSDLGVEEWRNGIGVSWIDDKEIRYLDAVGTDERITEVILERAREAGADVSTDNKKKAEPRIKKSHRVFIDWLTPKEGRSQANKFGELQIITDTQGQHEIRNKKDTHRPRAELTEAKPHIAHRIRKQDDNGEYRPLSGEQSLQTGWVMSDLTSQELVQAINKIYPAAIEFWHQDRTDSLEAMGYREATRSQTGLYSEVHVLSTEELRSLTSDICSESCIRDRRWSEHGAREHSEAKDVSIPCPEPCSHIIEAARKRQVKDGDQQKITGQPSGGEAL